MSLVVKFVNGIIYFNTGCLHGKTDLVFCKISQDIHVNKIESVSPLHKLHACKSACICMNWGISYALQSKGLNALGLVKDDFQNHTITSAWPYNYKLRIYINSSVTETFDSKYLQFYLTKCFDELQI